MILYHFTDPVSASKILRTNQFYLSMAQAAESDKTINKGRAYFLSTTRTRDNEFANKDHGVMFELDGSKLKHKYKSVPVDYWGNARYTESEERFVADDPTIPALKFIKSISINLSRTADAKYWRQIVLAAKTNNVPVRVYNDAKSMRQQNKKGQMSLTDMRILAPTKLTISPMRRERNPIEPWLVLAHAAIGKRMKQALVKPNRAVDDLIHFVRRTYGDAQYMKELTTQLNNDIKHSIRDPDKRAAKSARALVLTARKAGIKMDDLVKTIYASLQEQMG